MMIHIWLKMIWIWNCFFDWFFDLDILAVNKRNEREKKSRNTLPKEVIKSQSSVVFSIQMTAISIKCRIKQNLQWNWERIWIVLFQFVSQKRFYTRCQWHCTVATDKSFFCLIIIPIGFNKYQISLAIDWFQFPFQTRVATELFFAITNDLSTEIWARPTVRTNFYFSSLRFFFSFVI